MNCFMPAWHPANDGQLPCSGLSLQTCLVNQELWVWWDRSRPSRSCGLALKPAGWPEP